MDASSRKCGLRAAIMAGTMIACILARVGWTSESAESPSRYAVSALNDPNDLQWDLAEKFEFDWDSVELSSKIVKDAAPDSEACTLIISVRVSILDAKGLATIDVNSPRVIEALDENGRIVTRVPDKLPAVRCYEEDGWFWSASGAMTPRKWHPGRIVLPLPTDANHFVPSSISRLTGFIRVVYGEVIRADVSFDARGGPWLELENIPGLAFRVDASTPPPPGPINRGQAIALYKYKTWVKSQSGQPVMALRDSWPWYSAEVYPLGDYAIIRTELFDSRGKISMCFPSQLRWVQSCPAGSSHEGATCWGQMEQDEHNYDTIRHVIVGRAVEVRIPFVLTDIPVPNVRSASN